MKNKSAKNKKPVEQFHSITLALEEEPAVAESNDSNEQPAVAESNDSNEQPAVAKSNDSNEQPAVAKFEWTFIFKNSATQKEHCICVTTAVDDEQLAFIESVKQIHDACYYVQKFSKKAL